MERDQFLGRVKAALRGAELPVVVGPAEAPPIRFDDPVSRFIETAKAADADVVRAWSVPPPETGGRGVFIAWDGLEDIVPGIYDSLAEAGWERVEAEVGEATRLADHQRIGAATLGVTAVDVAIAATGSIVLAHGPRRPRSASLTVEHHVALLPIDRIVHSLDQALERVELDTRSNVVAITGPSRTGDIESILTLGVHGPRHLTIVVIG